MPCDSSHLEATSLEIELSRLLTLLKEVETGKPVDINSKDWQGYNDKVYNCSNLRKRADEATSTLCSKLKKLDVTKYSLELQMWWRDHQIADKKKRNKK